MKYTIDFHVSIREESGWTRLGYNSSKDVEVDKLSDLTPLLLDVEHLVEEFRDRH